MVKGVNKTVIEVNNTGSKVFERIVFYVNPTCSNLTAKHLKRAMQSFTFQFQEESTKHKTIRQRRITRRRVIIGAVATVVIAVAVGLIVIL